MSTGKVDVAAGRIEVVASRRAEDGESARAGASTEGGDIHAMLLGHVHHAGHRCEVQATRLS
jgi:hypothetical protein